MITTVGPRDVHPPPPRGRQDERTTTDDLVRVLTSGAGNTCSSRRSRSMSPPPGHHRGLGGQRHNGARGAHRRGAVHRRAVRNSGGIVLAQVERVTPEQVHPARRCRSPAYLDGVGVAPPENHPQTFAERLQPGLHRRDPLPARPLVPRAPRARAGIARRRLTSRGQPDGVVNLGIGMPEGIARSPTRNTFLDLITLTVEPGGIGGIPAGGLSFGAHYTAGHPRPALACSTSTTAAGSTRPSSASPR